MHCMNSRRWHFCTFFRPKWGLFLDQDKWWREIDVSRLKFFKKRSLHNIFHFCFCSTNQKFSSLMCIRLPAIFFRILWVVALHCMIRYCRLMANFEYLFKILIHYEPRACWNHYIRAHLWSKFNWLVVRSGSIFYWDIWELW